jgi:hypothetical protein
MGWGRWPRIKEDMTKRDYRNDPQAARFVAAISGYPEATEAEMWMLFDAAMKAGRPAHSLEHAERILSDNVYVFTPARESPYGSWSRMKFSGHDLSRWPPYKPFRAFGSQWRPDGVIIPKGEPSPKDFDDAVLAAHGLSELPKGEAGIRFVAWNHCPAVLVNDMAFAVLSPGGPWVSVDRDDVYHTGAEQSEGAWSKRFTDKFGPLDLSRWRPAAQAAANLEREIYDPGDKSPEAVAHRLYNSPDEIETRVMLATLRRLVARKEAKAKTAQAAANLEHAANLAHQIATAPLFLLPEIVAPSIAP